MPLLFLLLLLPLIMICFHHPALQCLQILHSSVCAHIHMCAFVCDVGSVVRRGSRKCDDRQMSCEAHFLARTEKHTYAGVVQPQAGGFLQRSGIATLVSTVQRIQLSLPYFLLFFCISILVTLHFHPIPISSIFFPPSPLSLCIPPPLSLLSLHPHIWNGSNDSYWLHGRIRDEGSQ